MNRFPGRDVAAGLPGASLFVAAMIWLLIIFNIVPEGFDYGSPGYMPTQGSAVSRLIWIFLLSTGFLVVLWRAALSLLLIRAINPFFLAFLVLAIASAAWSIDPGVTIRRLVRLLAIFSCACGFILVGWHNRRFQNVIRPVLTVMLLGSLVFGIVAPNLAIPVATQAELVGAWRGLSTQKNGFGSLASLGTIFWLHALFTREVRPVVAIAGAASAATCLYLSRSSTSLLATGCAVLILMLLVYSPRGMQRSLPAIIGLAAAALLVYSLAVLQIIPGLQLLLEPITAITGKDMSFTGRTDLWALIRERISQHPYLGGGFGSYWVGEVPSSQSYEFIARLNFYPGQAHNGYLDVINDLGFLGGVLLVGYLIAYLWQSLRLRELDRNQGTLYLALVFQQLVSNLSESRWWNVLSVEFVILTLATAALARDLLENRVRAIVAAGQHSNQS